MKNALKSIAKSMKILEECHVHTLENWNESIWMQKQNLETNQKNLSYHRDANRLMMKQFELEHTPVVSVLEGLLKMIPVQAITGVEQQEIVDEAKRMIRLMKSAQEKP